MNNLFRKRLRKSVKTMQKNQYKYFLYFYEYNQVTTIVTKPLLLNILSLNLKKDFIKDFKKVFYIH